ncbi:putative secreted protein [Salmonella enterica subsp. enterica serovar Montevideo str. S5-403]|uniref:Putative secreted protein n=2 Tax=Salmonella enterica TaxID=28901 RepID=G5PZ92_SALMO|nr:putative secreted protein [Salmonella enterica subsp. enterica serovar Montevideo str. S5-403]
MFRKAVTLLFLLSPAVSYAGLFDSSPELKCGNDNAVTAAKEWIYNEALGRLQQSYIKAPSTLFFDIPQTQYEQQLRAIPVQFSDVITQNPQPENANLRTCSATVTIGIPQPFLKLMKDLPDTLSYISQENSQVINNTMTWKEVNYNIQLADNNKDIVVTPVKKIYKIDVVYLCNGIKLTWSIYVMARMTVSGDNLIKKKNSSLIEIAAKKFESRDRELNQVWNSLPASARTALKQEQRVWVTKKEQQCGKLSDAKSEAIPAEKRISIYKCQLEMTIARTAYLDGSE